MGIAGFGGGAGLGQGVEAGAGPGHGRDVVALPEQVVHEGGTDVAGGAEDGDFLGHAKEKLKPDPVARRPCKGECLTSHFASTY